MTVGIPANAKQLAALVKKGEGPALEFKRSTGEVKEDMQTLCAFLNGSGGTASHETGQVIEQVLPFCKTPRKAIEIRELLGLKHRETFTDNYLLPLIEAGLLERTIPNKPRSRLQRYRTTEAGLAVLEQEKARRKS
jgi:hypothetical protein